MNKVEVNEAVIYSAPSLEDTLIHIPPWHYLYVLNTNSNVIRVETGPSRLTLLEHERHAFSS